MVTQNVWKYQLFIHGRVAKQKFRVHFKIPTKQLGPVVKLQFEQLDFNELPTQERIIS